MSGSRSNSDSDAAAAVHRPAGRRAARRHNVGEVLENLVAGTASCAAPVHAGRQAAQLRQHLRQRRTTSGISTRSGRRSARPTRSASSRRSPAARSPRVPSRAEAARAAADAHATTKSALQPAPDHAGGRRRGAAAAQGGARAVRRRRRARIAGVALPGGGRRRHARPRRLRHRRLQQPAAADPLQHDRRRPAEARRGARRG